MVFAAIGRGASSNGRLRIEELDGAAVDAHLEELAQLLLDAHASGMALGLAAPLSRDDARAAYVDAGATLSAGEHILLAAFDGDELLGAVQLDRSQAGNGRHRAESACACCGSPPTKARTRIGSTRDSAGRAPA